VGLQDASWGMKSARTIASIADARGGSRDRAIMFTRYDADRGIWCILRGFMIDSKRLAELVHEEAIYYAGCSSYSDEPALTKLEIFDRMSAEAPLASQAILTMVIEETFWASLLTEETRPCRPRLIYAPGPNSCVHRFLQPVALNRETLRRLSPAQGSGLVWEVLDGSAMIVGLHRVPGRTQGVTIYTTGPGAMDIRWSYVRILSFRAGEPLQLSTVKLGNAESITNYVARELSADKLGFMTPALEALMDHGHGGSIWVVSDGANLDGITIQSQSTPDARPFWERFGTDEASDLRRLDWLASLADLAAIDGAVLLDSDVRLLGFGAFVQLLETPVPVQKWIPGGRAKLTNSSEGWGSRHRSAAEFCAQFKPACAFVVSEDGRAHVFIARRNDIVQCHPLVSLGMGRPML
jgi:DisA bacterial checkpoint controller nucleotide-binding